MNSVKIKLRFGFNYPGFDGIDTKELEKLLNVPSIQQIAVFDLGDRRVEIKIDEGMPFKVWYQFDPIRINLFTTVKLVQSRMFVPEMGDCMELEFFADKAKPNGVKAND